VYVEDSCTDLYSLKLVAGDCVTALSLESHHHFSSLRWPLLQYPRPLPDCQPDARPMLDGRNKNPRLAAHSKKAVSGRPFHLECCSKATTKCYLTYADNGAKANKRHSPGQGQVSQRQLSAQVHH
jgi:hypothetical protein